MPDLHPMDAALNLPRELFSHGIRRMVAKEAARASFEEVLRAVRAHAPDLATSASGRDVKRALRRAWFGLSPDTNVYRLFQVPLMHRGRRVLTRRFARAARRAGLPVHAWVIDDPQQMQTLLAWGVTGIITDRPDLALDVVSRVRGHD